MFTHLLKKSELQNSHTVVFIVLFCRVIQWEKIPKKDHLWVQVLWKHTLVLKWLETFETKEGKIDHYVTIFSFWRWLIAQNCAWMTSVCKEKRTGEDCSGSGKREMHEKWGQNIIRFVFANFCSHPCKKYGCALRHAAQSSFRASFLNGQ